MALICLNCGESTLALNLKITEKYKYDIDLAEINAACLNTEEPDELELLSAVKGLILSFSGGSVSETVLIKALNDDSRLSRKLFKYCMYISLDIDMLPNYSDLLISRAEAFGVSVIKTVYSDGPYSETFTDRIIALSENGRFAVRAVVSPKNTEEQLQLFEAASRLSALENEKGHAPSFVFEAIGDYGVAVNLLSGKFGGLFMKAFCEDCISSYWQFSPEQLNDIYRFKKISETTSVYGIIGNPVMHSKSPFLHNGGYEYSGMDAVYIPFQTDDPGLFLEKGPELCGVRGLSVTVPHKQAVIPVLNAADDSVERIGACNTVVYDEKSGGWTGYNTDWHGFLYPLNDIELKGKTALVLGAGGASRSVVYALTRRGMDITIVNRSVDKARNIASEFGAGFDEIKNAGQYCNSFLVVQTTSVGMSPDVTSSPVAEYIFDSAGIAYDIIYIPEKTKFLQMAEASGVRIMNGSSMLASQGLEQFRLFTGVSLPPSVFGLQN